MRLVTFPSPGLPSATPEAIVVGVVLVVVGAVLGVGIEKAITKWLLDD